MRTNRDQAQVDAALKALTEAAKTGEGNLLELAVQAARVRASLGEISHAIEEVAGRHKATIRSISGVYSEAYSKEDEIQEVIQMTEEFLEQEGRRPRLLMAKMGQDGHDRGAKVVSTGFADLGYDVDIGPSIPNARRNGASSSGKRCSCCRDEFTSCWSQNIIATACG